MPAALKHDESSIVLLGSFNPAIFQPSWLARHGLIRDKEADAASITLISSEVGDFRVDWLHLQVIKEKFVAVATDAAHQAALRDLVMGVFSVLEHSPARKMGLNRAMHFAVDNEDAWHGIGHRLAPKAVWPARLERPGMRSLTMEGHRAGSPSQYVRVKVEPSTVVHPGIAIDCNEHVECKEDDAIASLMGILREQWVDAQAFAMQVADELLAGGT